MPDSKLNKGPQDRSRVNVNTRYERAYWTKKFKCTNEELEDAVRSVGVSVKKVQQFFKTSKPATAKVKRRTLTGKGLDVAAVRRDFPILSQKNNGKPLIYFDCAATSQKPSVVIDTLAGYYEREYSKVNEEHKLSKKTTQAVEAVREKVAKLIGTSSSKHIVFTRGTTESINIVARGFADAILKKDDEILLTEMEHHSNIVPWQMACAQTGAVIKVCPVNTVGELDMEAMRKLITSRTKIVCVSHASHVLGTILPVKRIAGWAREVGAALLVDGAQAVPHMPVNVKDLDCDFYAFSGHKITAPTGIGVLSGKPSWLNKIGPLMGGADMAEKVSFDESTYSKIPKKFEAGTPPFAQIIGLGAAIDFLSRLDLQRAFAYETSLLKYATARLQSIDKLIIYGTATDKIALISFLILGKDMTKLEKYLSEKWNIATRSGELTAQPLMKVLGVRKLLRISICYSNTFRDVDTLVEAINTFMRSKK